MCARFVIKTPAAEIASEFKVQEILFDLKTSFNVAPTQNIAAVINDEVNKLISCRWGLIPPWAKDMSFASRMINARAETVAEKPSFKKPFKTSRCLIVADGFFEWRKVQDKKIPMYISMKDGGLIGFAGLYSHWRPPGGESICTCAIITTEPNELLTPIHNRMPAIVKPDQREIWLNPEISDEKDLLPLLGSYDSDLMEAYEVSTAVNSPRNNSAENIKPVV
jgi:putative SOS response-associated peptidase YedK